ADPGAMDTVCDLLRAEFDVHAKGGNDISRAAPGSQGPVAVLDDRHSTRAGDDRSARGYVVHADAVATSANDIQGVVRSGDTGHLRPHGPYRSGDLVDSLAAHPERHQEAAHLRRCRLARHDDVECALGFGDVQRMAVGHLGDETLEFAHEL